MKTHTIKLVLSFVGFLFILLINSCRKDPVIQTKPTPVIDTLLVTDTCHTIPLPNGQEHLYIDDTIRYTEPYFNPNNKNEFLYVKRNSTAPFTQLFSYNLLTQTATLIFEGKLFSRPKWGSNNWILLGRSDNNVWKIDSHGNNLTQLTFSDSYSHPEWNKTSTQFIAAQYSSLKSVIFNANGMSVDTIDFKTTSSSSWQHGNLLVSYFYDYVDVVDPNTNQTINQYYQESYKGIYGSALWLSDTDIIWSSTESIYKSDINFNTVTLLKSFCANIIYAHASINSDKTKIIWQVMEQTYKPEGIVVTASKIVMMNTDGTGEIELDLP